MTPMHARLTTSGSARPDALRSIEPEKIVAIDVREDLRSGKEPFSLIMAARRRVPASGALSVRAIFEPVPLYAVMAGQGFLHYTEQLGEEDWQVWFYPGEEPRTRPAPDHRSGAAAAAPEGDPSVVVLDVRDMEPPEPMVRTLALLEQLPAGGVLLHINRRVPEFLLPQLATRGYTYEVREQAPDLVRVFIRRAGEAAPVHPQSETKS